MMEAMCIHACVLCVYMYMYSTCEYHGFESHPRQLIFPRKIDCLGCALLLCLVCLFDLACFFLPFFSSLIKACTVYIIIQDINLSVSHRRPRI